MLARLSDGMEHQNLFAIQFELARKQKTALSLRGPLNAVLRTSFVLSLQFCHGGIMLGGKANSVCDLGYF